MQLKTIERIIRKKITDWTLTIENEELRKKVLKHALVSGGSITSMLLGEDVNDYDVYFTDRAVAKAVSEYYVNRINSKDKSAKLIVLDGQNRDAIVNEMRGHHSYEDWIAQNNAASVAVRNLREGQIKIFVQNGGGHAVDQTNAFDAAESYRPLFISPNAISLSDDLQIVIRFHGTPEEIHKTFDFIHATNYWTSDRGLVTRKEALESIITKTLKYQGSLYPLTSIIRVKKFVARRWKVSAGDMLKMIYQSGELDLNNADVLEEQLIGVDVAYFGALISALRAKQESEPGFKLNSDYLGELIDRVFSGAEFFREEE